MTEDLKNYTEENIATTDQKLSWWGYGEWVEEPDAISFEYQGLECRIQRIIARETLKHFFGGHLCGYVKVPDNHLIYGKGWDDEELHQIDAHGGITYSEIDKGNNSYLPLVGHWIGFDCAHANDYTPSMEYLNRTVPELIKIQLERKKRMEKYGVDTSLFEKTYRNVDFCIEECKNIVKQLHEITQNAKEIHNN